MIKFKQLGLGILLVIIACIGIPHTEAQYRNEAWLQHHHQQQREVTDRLMEGERLGKACVNDGEGSHACTQYDEFLAREAKRSQAIDRIAALWKARMQQTR